MADPQRADVPAGWEVEPATPSTARESKTSGVPEGWEVVPQGGAAVPTPKMEHAGGIVGWLTDAVGPRQTGNDLPRANGVGPQTRTLATTPLAHPTGIDIIDQLTSPANIAILAGSLGKPATMAALKGVSALADVVSPDVVGIFSPKLANAMRVAMKIRTAQTGPAASPAPGPAQPPEPNTQATGTSMAPAPQPVMTPRPAPVVPPSPPQQTGTSMAPAPMPPPVARPAAPEPVAGPSEPPPTPTEAPKPAGPPSQKQLNEEAIARRRAAYQESLKAQPEAAAPADPAAALKASSSFANLPTDAERRFPPNKSGLPFNAPRVVKARGKIADLADMPPSEPAAATGPTAEDIARVSAATKKKFSGTISDLADVPGDVAKYDAKQMKVNPQPSGATAPTEAAAREALGTIRSAGFDLESYDEQDRVWILDHSGVSDRTRSRGGSELGRRSAAVTKALAIFNALPLDIATRLINE